MPAVRLHFVLFASAAVGPVEKSIAADDLAAEAAVMNIVAERVDQLQAAISRGSKDLLQSSVDPSEPSVLARVVRFTHVGFASLDEQLQNASRFVSIARGDERGASFLSLADPLSSMKDMIEDTPVAVAPDMRAIAAASDVVKGIASVPAPRQAPSPLDPRRDCRVDTVFIRVEGHVLLCVLHGCVARPIATGQSSMPVASGTRQGAPSVGWLGVFA